LLGFEDTSVIDDYVRQQKDNPAPYKEVDGHPVYQSRPDFGSLRKGIGLLKISDFGTAVFGNVSSLHHHDIQPEQFCAPEVLLKAGWTYSADIWNLGMVVRHRTCWSCNATNLYPSQLWELLEDTSLLDGLGPESDEYSREAHFAQMIGLLGPPPQELLNRADGAVYSGLYTTQGMQDSASACGIFDTLCHLC
jgi:serine/threonine-protein kinase SRPK3